ncbi:uroporphyrin-III methyltransferase [Oceanobacillus picturae]|uniref:Uroporphyrin-III methyltransferase n=1 Tax=Oceanobacillus picturae TaxID=171693 RepID=A0A0U9H8E3_9BACI|nr:uroporphyrin-III methyltransferase [Oceanobacillus picturae]
MFYNKGQANKQTKGGFTISIVLQRIYEEESELGGNRVLVDRVWPRGISKADAGVDYWAKEVAPSTKLRKWFCHDPDKFDKFKQLYKEELAQNEEKQEALEKLKEMATNERLILLYGAKDKNYNHVNVLKEVLEGE